MAENTAASIKYFQCIMFVQFFFIFIFHEKKPEGIACVTATLYPLIYLFLSESNSLSFWKWIITWAVHAHMLKYRLTMHDRAYEHTDIHILNFQAMRFDFKICIRKRNSYNEKRSLLLREFAKKWKWCFSQLMHSSNSEIFYFSENNRSKLQIVI